VVTGVAAGAGPGDWAGLAPHLMQNLKFLELLECPHFQQAAAFSSLILFTNNNSSMIRPFSKIMC
jgi:hypothetical protein